MVDHQLRDDAQSALVRRREKRLEIRQRSEVRIDVEIIRDVIAVVAHRRRVKGQQPERRYAEVLKVIEPIDQPAEVAHPVAAAVLKSLDVQFVDDRVFVPKRIGREGAILGHPSSLPQKTAGAIFGSTGFIVPVVSGPDRIARL